VLPSPVRTAPIGLTISPKDSQALFLIASATPDNDFSEDAMGRVEGGYYPAPLSVKSGRAIFTAPSFRYS
jgi:hypothetical protein